MRSGATALAALLLVAAAAAAETVPGRALWHWESKRDLDDAARFAEMLAFCRRERIDRIWMQLEPPLPSRLRPLLAAAHKAGVAVEVLDGFPEYALREGHRTLHATVDAVAAFNRDAPAGERIDGVHFDNEIHLLLGWHSRAMRPQLLAEFLEGHVDAQKRAREAGVTFGVDVPFWWAAGDDVSVAWSGARKPIGLHLVERLDVVGIMDYRDQAAGPDGIIAHAEPILAYADSVPGARIYVGIETIAPPPNPVWLVFGRPRADFERALEGPARDLGRSSRLDGLRLRALDDGERIHVGVELPASPSSGDEERATRALATIADALGAGDAADGPAMLAVRERAIAKTRERGSDLVDARAREFVHPATGARMPGLAGAGIMLPKVTFGDDPPETLRRELEASEAGLRRHRRFAGMALHYYDSYRAKVDPRGVP